MLMTCSEQAVLSQQISGEAQQHNCTARPQAMSARKIISGCKENGVRWAAASGHYNVQHGAVMLQVQVLTYLVLRLKL